MLRIYHQEEVARLCKRRQGEVKLGERIKVMRPSQNLTHLPEYTREGVRFVLLGCPESIGPQANYGRAGSERGWSAFLQAFLNTQSNRFLMGEEVLLLGHILTDDLQAQAQLPAADEEQRIRQLRYLVGQIDQRLGEVLQSIYAAGLIPILIGGGHNNAYPLLKSWHQVHQKPLQCINCDPHADVRPLEGRHSGNSFSYAFESGYMSRYLVVGMHQAYNSEANYRFLEHSDQLHWINLEEISDWDSAVEQACAFFDAGKPLGLELDMDAISYMPSSASGPAGISVEQARIYVRIVAQKLNPVYLHLPEAAPGDDLQSKVVAGKALSYLVRDFIASSAV